MISVWYYVTKISWDPLRILSSHFNWNYSSEPLHQWQGYSFNMMFHQLNLRIMSRKFVLNGVHYSSRCRDGSQWCGRWNKSQSASARSGRERRPISHLLHHWRQPTVCISTDTLLVFHSRCHFRLASKMVCLAWCSKPAVPFKCRNLFDGLAEWILSVTLGFLGRLSSFPDLRLRMKISIREPIFLQENCQVLTNFYITSNAAGKAENFAWKESLALFGRQIYRKQRHFTRIQYKIFVEVVQIMRKW